MSERSFKRLVDKHFPGRSNDEINNCPSCGKDDMLWGIIESVMTAGVGCRRCRLKITRDLPRNWPRKMPKDVAVKDAVDWLYLWSFFIALKKWNKLPRS